MLTSRRVHAESQLEKADTFELYACVNVMIIFKVIFWYISGGLYLMLNLDDFRGSGGPLTFCTLQYFYSTKQNIYFFELACRFSS